MAQPISAEDLYRFRWIDHVRLSPDGRRVAYQVVWPDAEARENCSRIFVRDLGPDSDPVEVTDGPRRDHSAAWSPDGRSLAFVSRRGARDSLCLVDLETRETRRLTSVGEAISAPRWSSDGKRIAFVARVLSDGGGVVDDPRPPESEDESRRTPIARVATRLDYKADGKGFADGRADHLFVVDVDGGEPTQLTSGPASIEAYTWSPDGGAAVAANFESDGDVRLERHIYVLEPGGTTRRLVEGLDLSFPSWSPTGEYIAFIARPVREGGAYERVWVVKPDGSDVRCLTAEVDLWVGDGLITDMRGGHATRLVWSGDGTRIYFLGSGPGQTGVYSVDLAAHVTQHLGGARQVYDFDFRQDTLAFCASDAANPGDLHLQRGGNEARLTKLNAWLDDRYVATPQQFIATAPDGLKIEGWYLVPPGFDPSRRYPLVMEIHGGPHGQYGHAFFHEFQVLAGLGFVVFYANPRGSNGYGEAFQRACVRDWGGKDYVDLMTALDQLIEQGFVDESRMGVGGGSYGGYMTNWIIGQTDRFAAAVSMRCISNLISEYAQHDIVPWGELELGPPPWLNFDELWRRSPLRYVENMRTPLLLTHGEMDLRCAISQAEELFGALRLLGREVEMVRFPGESHDLSRAGRPDRRVERLNRIAGWFQRYLMQGEARSQLATETAALD